MSFLDQGEPPVYLGWGSCGFGEDHNKEMMIKAVSSLKRSGCRGVILGGWADLNIDMLVVEEEDLASFAKSNVFVASSVDHSWLFPKCSAIVHHGGAGTLAAALRSGIAMTSGASLLRKFYK
eukprot:m.353515 g.353515  ORF g.353515 m.353515 type:complete len:122 (-) comp65587_c0_seq1:45-410(-)